MKMCARLRVGMVCLVVATAQCAAPLTAQTIDSKTLYDRCASAVVRIETEKGLGTGFFIHPQYIVTNKHVIERKGIPEEYRRFDQSYYSRTQITVKLRSGQTLPVAKVIPFREHPDIDLAVLKVRAREGTSLPILPTLVEVGEPVVAIGHPLGSGWTQTAGTVSNNSYEHYIQLNLALDPGNSGGPIINARGQVVGVHAMGYLNSMTGKYGIRSDVLKELLDYYNIPYSTEPLVRQKPEKASTPCDDLLSQLQERESRLRQDEDKLRQQEKALTEARIQLERDRAEFNAKERDAKLFLAEYEDKRKKLEDDYEYIKDQLEREYLSKREQLHSEYQLKQRELENEFKSKKNRLEAEYRDKQNQIEQQQQEIKKREQQLIAWESSLNDRERWISAKEQAIWSTLNDHLSVDIIAQPTYDLHSNRLVPLRTMGGIYYRFGIVRNRSTNEVERADKIGIMVARQISPIGWEQDEVALALEFSSLVRVTFGAVILEPDRTAHAAITPPQSRYLASAMLDFIPASPLIFGIALTAQTDQRFRSTTVMAGFVIGYEVTFLRW